jgi:hypothetical protein
MEVTPFGIVQVPVPVVKVIMQSFPLATAVAVTPETVGVQSAFANAFAVGAETIEIAESVETAKTKGKNEETKRRALRMKVTRLAPISVISLSGPQDNCPILDRTMSQ